MRYKINVGSQVGDECCLEIHEKQFAAPTLIKEYSVGTRAWDLIGIVNQYDTDVETNVSKKILEYIFQHFDEDLES